MRYKFFVKKSIVAVRGAFIGNIASQGADFDYIFLKTAILGINCDIKR